MISVYYQHPHSISLSRNDDTKVWESLRKYLNNKDGNTHTGKALKSQGKTNEKNLVECQNLTNRTLICKSKQKCT